MAELNAIAAQFVESQNEVKNIKRRTEDFLKSFANGFNGYINGKPNISVEVKDPVYRFADNFPIHFNMSLSLSVNGNYGTYTLPCTAIEMSENEYRINDGMSQHPFFMDSGHQEENARTFEKFSQNFIRKFREFGDMKIDLS